MHRRWISALTLGALALTGACGSEPTSVPSINVSIQLCPALLPDWIAYQNEGGPWTQLTPDAVGVVSFDASPRLTIARVMNFSGNRFTQIAYLARGDLADLVTAGAFGCESSAGTATISGTFTGLTGEQFARISASSQTIGRAAAEPAFTITGLPSTAHDVVATRWPTQTSTPAHRVVVRRGVAHSSTMAAIDFDGDEAHTVQTNLLTLSNAGTGTLAVDVDFFTSGGTKHRMMQSSVSGGATGSIAIVGVPALIRASGDVHQLSIVTNDATGTRQILAYYNAPGDMALAFRSHVNTATTSTVATTPYLRPRALLVSQADYPSAARVEFSQTLPSGFRSVSVIATFSFTGSTPGSWDLTVPDMSAAGYLPAWGLEAGTALNTNVYAYRGNVVGVFGARAGSTFEVAMRSQPNQP